MSGEQLPTRGALLARIEEGWSALLNAIESMPVSALNAPGTAANWSVADQLWHLWAWERKLVAQIRGESIPAALGISEAIWASDDIDALNAGIQAGRGNRSAEEILAEYRVAHAATVATIEALAESDYGRPGYPDEPESAPLVGYIAGNTFEHYAEHAAGVRGGRES